MGNLVFHVNNQEEYRKAGPEDLIELLPVPGSHPLFILKKILEPLVFGIVNHEFIHISGPTGTAKSSLIDAFRRVPGNFRAICHALGFPVFPIKIYPIEMATYETPGELYQRRSLKNGTTFDEKSMLVQALEKAVRCKGKCYPVIWLREMGRVHTSSVQGGLLDLMTRDNILLPDGTRINGQGIAWVADSNYQAEGDSTHTLVTFDDALKRRFSINLTLDYLSPEYEARVLEYIFPDLIESAHDLIRKVVKLGKIMRQKRTEGNLQSIPPPTIWGYAAFIRMAQSLPQMSLQHIALSTLLGNGSSEDRKMIYSLFQEVFGLQSTIREADPAFLGNLF